MLQRFRFLKMMALLLLTPITLTSVYYVIKSPRAYSPTSIKQSPSLSPFKNAVRFKDGGQSFIETTAIRSSSLEKSNGLTVDLRVKPLSVKGMPIITKFYNRQNYGPDWAYSLSLYPVNEEKMGLQFTYRSPTTDLKGNIASDKVPIYPNKWAHIGLYSSGIPGSHPLILFVNGVPVIEIRETEFLGHGPKSLGELHYLIGANKGIDKDHQQYFNSFEGEIDELRVTSYDSYTRFDGYSVEKALPYNISAGPYATLLFHFDEMWGCPIGKGYINNKYLASTLYSKCSNIQFIPIISNSLSPTPIYISPSVIPSKIPLSPTKNPYFSQVFPGIDLISFSKNSGQGSSVIYNLACESGVKMKVTVPPEYIEESDAIKPYQANAYFKVINKNNSRESLPVRLGILKKVESSGNYEAEVSWPKMYTSALKKGTHWEAQAEVRIKVKAGWFQMFTKAGSSNIASFTIDEYAPSKGCP